jgi:DNA-binding NtrC family response regulator
MGLTVAEPHSGMESPGDARGAGIARHWLAAYTKARHETVVARQLEAKAVAHLPPTFLDEIGDMDLAVQPKILKVLETRHFRRLGDMHDRTVDVRLISATHRDLKELVRQQRFREDLYFRINIIPLRLPPLRERTEDIPKLAEEILRRIGAERGWGEIRLDDSAMKLLAGYPWPGNIREMRNVLERAAQLAQHSPLTVRDLDLQHPGNGVGGAAATPSSSTMETNLTMREMETRYIEVVLAEEEGSIDRAAKRLGISRSSLYGKVKNREVERAVR